MAWRMTEKEAIERGYIKPQVKETPQTVDPLGWQPDSDRGWYQRAKAAFPTYRPPAPPLPRLPRMYAGRMQGTGFVPMILAATIGWVIGFVCGLIV